MATHESWLTRDIPTPRTVRLRVATVRRDVTTRLRDVVYRIYLVACRWESEGQSSYVRARRVARSRITLVQLPKERG